MTTDYSALTKMLTIKSAMIQMGEKIAWGSDSAIIDDAAATITTLQAQLDAVKPRPIEEAPKDGTWVCLIGGKINYGWYHDQPPMVIGQWTAEAPGNTHPEGNWQFAWYDSGYYGEYEHPTHFIPLSSLGTPT